MQRAMILAAGYGKRMLSSLVGDEPIHKALLQVGDKRLIEYHLDNLAAIGITEVVINLHYLADQMRSVLGDGERYGLKILYSYEVELLGTGGGIKQALPLLGNEPFILLSADVWTDYALANLQLPKDELAHLVLVDNNAGKHEDFSLSTNGKLTLAGKVNYTYASLAVLHPQLVQHFRGKYFGFKELITYALQMGQAGGEYFTGRWFNTNTPEDLTRLKAMLDTSQSYEETKT